MADYTDDTDNMSVEDISTTKSGIPVPSPSIQDTEVFSLLQELRQEASDDDEFRRFAGVVESLCTNRGIDTVVSQTSLSTLSVDNTMTMQILENLVLTWAALINKDRPSVYGVPLQDDIQSTVAAEIATKYIEYIETEESVADKWHQSAIWAAQHGTGMMRINYDIGAGRVKWENVSIFDVFLQNQADPDKVQWCLIRSYIDQYDARDMVKAARADNPVNREEYVGLPATTTYTDSFGISRRGVEKWEIWYKPGARYPNGLYACIVADTIIEQMDYPYIFPEVDSRQSSEIIIDENGVPSLPEQKTKALLPVVWWNCRKNRGATLGLSWTRDVAPLQVQVNNLLSKMLEDARQARQWLVLPPSLRNSDLIDVNNARLFVSRDDAAGIKWVNPAPLDPSVQTVVKTAIESMYVTAGISQSTMGDAAASQSGKALAFQAQLDSDKHADAWKNFEKAQKQAWELTLKIIQKFYEDTQQVNIVGGDNIAFKGADLAGVTVKLEGRSESQSNRSTKVENSRQDMASGFAGKEALLSTPTPQTAGLKMLAQDIINQLLTTGQTPDITPSTVPPEIMIQAIEEIEQSAALRRDYETVEALRSFKQDYLRMISGVQVADAPATPPASASTPEPIPGAGEAMNKTAEEGLKTERS